MGNWGVSSSASHKEKIKSDMQPTVRVVNCEKIKKCCDEINDIVKPLGYISHRTVQELLCEIINEVKNE